MQNILFLFYEIIDAGYYRIVILGPWLNANCAITFCLSKIPVQLHLVMVIGMFHPECLPGSTCLRSTLLHFRNVGISRY